MIVFLGIFLVIFSATTNADTSPSSCSYLQCAISHGNCGNSDSENFRMQINFDCGSCPAGEHCSNSQCVDNLPLLSTCNVNVQENECSQGKCVDTGNGPQCQIYREIMPGNPCTSDNECYYSQNADGSGAAASTCDMDPAIQIRKCAGKQVNEDCVASHQCIVGSYCSESTKTCTPHATQGQFCSSDSECSSRFTCLDGQCSLRYSRTEGQSCANTAHCQSGLYCNSDTCTKVSTVASSSVACDIGAPSCPANEQCTCRGYVTQDQIASCTAIKGTYPDMATIEKAAYSCLDNFNCGSDTNNATTIDCISSYCVKEYCTFFTRHANELFAEYPACLVSRMVNNNEYYTLLSTCTSYKPKSEEVSSESNASFLFASFSWIPFVLFLSC